MRFFEDVCKIVGGVWLTSKIVKGCFVWGEMNATYRMSKKLYVDLTGHKESE